MAAKAQTNANINPADIELPLRINERNNEFYHHNFAMRKPRQGIRSKSDALTSLSGRQRNSVCLIFLSV